VIPKLKMQAKSASRPSSGVQISNRLSLFNETDTNITYRKVYFASTLIYVIFLITRRDSEGKIVDNEIYYWLDSRSSIPGPGRIYVSVTTFRPAMRHTQSIHSYTRFSLVITQTERHADHY
jgi:hypothetical protein